MSASLLVFPPPVYYFVAFIVLSLSLNESRLGASLVEGEIEREREKKRERERRERKKKRERERERDNTHKKFSKKKKIAEEDFSLFSIPLCFKNLPRTARTFDRSRVRDEARYKKSRYTDTDTQF
jgi:hypothetical protein